MSVSALNHRPQDIAVDRAAGTVTITWADRHISTFDVRWLRANCPCATCREQRWVADQNHDVLTLTDAPPPSTHLAGAELVGGYAIQFEWADGHNSGIYTYAALRRTCPCKVCNPDRLPLELG